MQHSESNGKLLNVQVSSKSKTANATNAGVGCCEKKRHVVNFQTAYICAACLFYIESSFILVGCFTYKKKEQEFTKHITATRY